MFKSMSLATQPIETELARRLARRLATTSNTFRRDRLLTQIADSAPEFTRPQGYGGLTCFVTSKRGSIRMKRSLFLSEEFRRRIPYLRFHIFASEVGCAVFRDHGFFKNTTNS
jgi:hypothetical protein